MWGALCPLPAPRQPSSNAALALHQRCACAGVALARRRCEGGRGACRSPYICCLARWTRSQQYWQSVSNFVAMWADIQKVFYSVIVKCKNLIILRSVLCGISKTLSVQEGIVLQSWFNIGIPFTESKNYYFDNHQLFIFSILVCICEV